MAESQLMLHCGARTVEEDELRACRAPPPEGRWYPISHGRVLDTVKGTLTASGYTIRSQKLALTKGESRFFGVLDLATTLYSEVTLAVGIRNSVDKTFPMGFAAGSRVFCCDNLAFRSELMVKRKHTRFGEQRFVAAIAGAVTSLTHFREVEAARIKRMMYQDLTDDQADALILRAFEKGIVTAPFLPRVIREWRTPSFEEFEPRTAWSLLNAFTTVLGERAERRPQAYTVQTMRLNALLGPKDASQGQFAQAT